MVRSKLLRRLEAIFWSILLINPFLDIFTGFYYNIILGMGTYELRKMPSLGITPSLVVRLVFLLFFALYLLILWDKKSILALLPIGGAFLLSLLSEWFTFGGIAFFTDAQYIVKFTYNILVLMVYSRVFFRQWESGKREIPARIERLLVITAVILSVSILVPAFFGIGFSTYADRFGYRGNCGFFYSANDITAVFALLQPLTLGLAMRDSKSGTSLPRVIACALTANTLLIIGSKTAFLAVAFSFVLMAVYALVVSLKTRSAVLWRGYLWSLGCAVVLLMLLILCSGGRIWELICVSFGITGSLVETEGAEVAFLSGRLDKLRSIFPDFRNGGILVWLFGLSRGSREVVLEMDLFEVFFYYGLVGCVALLWFYVRLAVQFFISLFRHCDEITFAGFTALGLVFGYLFLAGHVLFTVTSGLYFSLVIVFLRAHTAERKEDVLLWKDS